MPLHEDTLAFLEARNALREQLRAALKGETTEDGSGDLLEPQQREIGDPLTPCTVPARESSEGEGECEIGDLPYFECLRDVNGWPNSAGLYETLWDALSKEDDANNVGDEQIRLMRQINVLESYRKMLLHKKQNVCHYLAAWCQALDKEPQSYDELQRLMLNQSIGQVVEPEEDDETEEDEEAPP